MFAKNLISVTASLAILGACDPNDNRDFLGLTTSDAAGHRVAGVIRHLSACPSDVGNLTRIDPASPLQTKQGQFTRKSTAGVVAATAADFAIEIVGEAFEREKTARTGQSVASGVLIGPERVISGDSRFMQNGDGCLVIYRGALGEAAETPSETTDVTPMGSQPTKKLSRSATKALGLADLPAFYAEFLMDENSVPDRRILTLNYVSYAETSAIRAGSGMKSVTVALSLGASTGEDGTPTPDQDKAELYRFDLGRLKIGQYYHGDAVTRLSSSKVGAQGSNMVALITEAEDPSVALTALAKAFEKNQSDLREALLAKLKGED